MLQKEELERVFWSRFHLYLLSFIEGFLSIHSLMMFFLNHTTCGLMIQLTHSIELRTAFVPLINPLLGYFSDRVAFFGWHRKSYLVVLGILTAGGYLFLGLLPGGEHSYLLLLLISLYMEFVNQARSVVLSSYFLMVIQDFKHPDLPGLNKPILIYRQMSNHFGRLLSLGILALYPVFENRLFFVLAAFALISSLSAFYAPEVATLTLPKRFFAHFAACFRIIGKENLAPLMISNFIISSTPSIESVLRGYLHDVGGISRPMFAVRSLIARLGILAAVFCTHTLFKDVKRSLFTKISSVIYVPVTLICFSGVAFRALLGRAAIVFFLVFAALRPFVADLKAFALLSILVEKAPEGSQGSFSAVMSYLEHISLIAARTSSSVALKRLGISDGNYENMDRFMLIHVVWMLFGNVFLIFSPVP